MRGLMNKGVLVVTVALAAAPVAAQDDDFGFEIMEAQVEDADKARFDDAKSMMANEQYSEAVAVFDEIRLNGKLEKYHEEAQYEAAKALYRMGLYHSSLTRFNEILEVGPDHGYFNGTKEWLFFIARKMADRERVLKMLAAYTKAEQLPSEYANEFNYQLARFHFLGAIEQGAKGVDVEQSEVEEEEGSGGGGFDFSGVEGSTSEGDESVDDAFGTDAPEGGSMEESESEDEGGGFDFSEGELGGGDDDGFSFDLGEAAVEEDDKPKKGKKGKKVKVKNEKKSHKNENPENAEAALRLALGHLERVRDDFDQYPKALYLKGLTHFALGEFEPSVDAFRQVVRMTDPKKEGGVNNPKLREMAFFSLARIHYQFEQFRYAIFYYERIDRDSEQWLDSLFESSWAYFRLGEYERALGNLVTIQSPFFKDEYYPEGHILKAITFYENCRYPEARSFLTTFEGQYNGVIDELKRLLEGSTGEGALYDELSELDRRIESGEDDAQGSSEMTARLLRIAFKDKRLQALRDAILEVEAEKARLGATPPPFGGTDNHIALMTKLDERRKALAVGASALLKEKLDGELAFLQDLSAKLVRIQFEITKQEKEALAASLKGQSFVKENVDYDFTTATDDERVYWPFLGEYWRDELGTYVYTLKYGCRPPEEEG
jgi:tetratricopeptide (TPR) repeat protein